MAKPAVVLDSNVWISGILWTGAPHRIVRMVERNEVQVFASTSILEELRDALSRPKFAARFHALQSSVSEVMDALASLITIVAEVPLAPVVREDPDDDKMLACAVSSKADFLVTGDAHLLRLGSFRSVSIVTPSDFLRELASRSRR